MFLYILIDALGRNTIPVRENPDYGGNILFLQMKLKHLAGGAVQRQRLHDLTASAILVGYDITVCSVSGDGSFLTVRELRTLLSLISWEVNRLSC